MYEEDWFYGYSPSFEISTINQDSGSATYSKVDLKNVVGRFSDHQVIDGEKSREAGKSIYKKTTILETRCLSVINGRGTDISSTPIRFDRSYREASLKAIARFPEAWTYYQKVRKAQILEDEFAAIDDNKDFRALYPRVPRKAKKEVVKDNVIPLEKESA